MNKLTRSIAGLAAGILISQSALATHFRGGQITWDPADMDGDGQLNDIAITVTSYWRSDFVEDIELSIKPVLDIIPLTDDTQFIGGSRTAVDSHYAIRTQTYEVRNLSLLRPYTLVFDGGDRISTLQNNADAKWALQSTAYLGGGNLPPEINFPIYGQIPQEDEDGNLIESWTLDASVPDRNGHVVKYRLANLSELGGKPSFSNPEGLSVDPDTGLVTWNGSGGLAAGLYSGGIVAEDFNAEGKRISRTHLDFVLDLGMTEVETSEPEQPGNGDGGEEVPGDGTAGEPGESPGEGHGEEPGEDGHHHGGDEDETPASERDTDADGHPDAVDLDSDNDGLPDRQEAPGIVIPGGEGDEDGDGIDDSIDVDITGGDDIDGDGIDDALQADTDGDGVPDRLDLDSDNDGIPDVVEAYDPAQIDANNDGTIDNIRDEDGNGLHDDIADTDSAADTDDDGIPDYLDLDSDGDGRSDLIEGGAESDLDANEDGMLDDLIDVDTDGIADAVDGHIPGFAAGTPASLPDSDGDGVYDFRDPSSDDGSPTGNPGSGGAEEGEAGGEEVPDQEAPGPETPEQPGQESPQQPDQESPEQETPEEPQAAPDPGAETPRLRTAVKGGGSGDVWLLLMMGGLFAAARRRAGVEGSLPRMKRLAVAVPVVVMNGLVAQAHAQEDSGCRADKSNSNCWYVGGGIGASQLDPEGSSNGWSTDDDQDTGFEVHVGQHFRPHWFWELSYAAPGEASLRHPDTDIMASAPDAAIEYKIPSLTAGYYLWEKSGGWNLYAKAGVSAIDTKSQFAGIEVDEETSAQLVLGAGVQYHFNNTPWFARLEFNHFDRDARFASLKLSRAFGYQARSSSAKADDDIAVIPADHDADEIPDFADSCPNTPPTLVVSEKGCSVLNDVIHGVHFATDSIELSLDATNHLLDAAAQLKANPSIRVEVQAHTDNVGEEEYNLWLSEQRAEAVKDYLLQEGVSEAQVVAQGYGESQPIASNDTAQGRARNRRVEFRILD